MSWRLFQFFKFLTQFSLSPFNFYHLPLTSPAHHQIQSAPPRLAPLVPHSGMRCPSLRGRRWFSPFLFPQNPAHSSHSSHPLSSPPDPKCSSPAGSASPAQREEVSELARTEGFFSIPLPPNPTTNEQRITTYSPISPIRPIPRKGETHAAHAMVPFKSRPSLYSLALVQ